MVDRPMLDIDDRPDSNAPAIGERERRPVNDRTVLDPVAWLHRFRQCRLLSHAAGTVSHYTRSIEVAQPRQRQRSFRLTPMEAGSC